MRTLLSLLFLSLAVQLSAQEYPAKFFVQDVASDDRLNIRALPSASADIIGDYGPFALNIEVLETSPDGRWGKVGIGERNGWVSMRYLAFDDSTPAFEMPRPLSCFGTEPFWSLNMTVRGDEYDELDESRRNLTLLSSAIAPSGGLATFEEGPTLNRTLMVRRAACNDGMSDRDFGWTAALFTEAPDGNSLVTGCCTLDGN